MKIHNRPTGLNAFLWALAFVWGAIRGRVTLFEGHAVKNALCLEMTRSRVAPSYPFRYFWHSVAMVYFALCGQTLRMDDTGLYIQLEYWSDDQTE